MSKNGINFDIKQNFSVSIIDSVTKQPIKLANRFIDWITVTKEIVIRHSRRGQAGVCEIQFSMLGDAGVLGGRGLLGKNNSILPFTGDLGSLVTVRGSNIIDNGISEVNGVVEKLTQKKMTLFQGFIHTIEYNEQGDVKISCYDFLYYFKNKVFVLVKKNMTAKALLEEIPKQINSILGVGVDIGYKFSVSPVFTAKYNYKFTQEYWEYGKSALDLINWVLTRVAASGLASGTPFSSYMNFFIDYDAKTIKVEPSEEATKRLDIIIGQGSLLQNYSVSHTMLNVTNVFHIMSEMSSVNQEKAIKTFKEEMSIKQLGEIHNSQHFSADTILMSLSEDQQMNSDLTYEAIGKIGRGFVLHNNKPQTKLTVNAIGHCGVRAGYLLPIMIPNLTVIIDAGSKGGFTYSVGNTTPVCLIDEVEHVITDSIHTMRITSSVALNRYNTWMSVTEVLNK